MKKNISRLFFALIAVVGLLASSASADLGLTQMLADPSQGVPAVEQAVLTAIRAAYSGAPDAAALQAQLIAILNEVAATGNDQAVRYAIIAVMGVGGVENIEASKAAINNSSVLTNYGLLAATTMAEAENLMRTAGGGGGEGQGGSGGGKTDEKGKDVTTKNLLEQINSSQLGSAATRT